MCVPDKVIIKQYLKLTNTEYACFLTKLLCSKQYLKLTITEYVCL